MVGLKKSFCRSISNCLHIHLNTSQNVSPTLLLHGMVMVSNEESIDCLQMFRIRKCKEIFALISHFPYIFEIIQITSAIKDH